MRVRLEREIREAVQAGRRKETSETTVRPPSCLVSPWDSIMAPASRRSFGPTMGPASLLDGRNPLTAGGCAPAEDYGYPPDLPARYGQDGCVPLSVLIVDDHEPFRRIIGALLRDSGHRIVGEAGTGAQGLEAAARLLPQAVLLDVGLPDMDGFEVAARLTADGHGPAIVLASADPGPDFEALALRAGARRFVAKDDLAHVALHDLWH